MAGRVRSKIQVTNVIKGAHLKSKLNTFDATWQSRYWRVKHAEFLIVAIVFLVVYLMRNGLPADFRSAIKWQIFFVTGLIEWFLYFFLFLSLKYNFFRWYKTIRIVGLPSWSTQKVLLRLAKFKEHQSGLPQFLLFPGTLILGGLFYFTRLTLFFTLLLLIVVQRIVDYFRRIVPPAVLFLATTDEDTLLLHARICFAIQRLRAVALLKFRRSGTELVSIVSAGDSFRTTSDELWEEVVEKFIQLSPIIVLDVRKVSPAIVHEIHRIISNKLMYKLILVIGLKGERPLVEYIESFEDLAELQGVPLVTQDGVLAVLKYLTSSRSRLPTSHVPIGSIMRRSGQCRTIDQTQWAEFADKV